LYTDLPSHRSDDPLTDRQAQPRSSWTGAFLPDDLMKGLEQVGYRSRGDSNTRIANRKPDLRGVLSCRARLDAQRDETPLCEFDRVADKIQQYLLESVWIGHHPVSRARVQIN